jgi:23S rRNA (adenine-N6)-dimethyltransferase
VGARSRSRRTAAERPDGQHLLRSRGVASELVRDARIARDDLVVEIGAGDGRLTVELARHARRVDAVELDASYAARLRERFADDPRVRVSRADVRTVRLPKEPFRAFGNIPFAVTNAVLRRLLDDPRAPLTRADLIVQWEAARKRTAPWPSTALSLRWLPWWELAIVRRVPRTGFEPPPSVDAAMLRITRRADPLLGAHRLRRYEAFVRLGFEHPTWPIAKAFRGVVPPLAWKRLARARGIAVDATPRHLDVWDWVALFDAVDGSPARRAHGA